MRVETQKVTWSWRAWGKGIAYIAIAGCGVADFIGASDMLAESVNCMGPGPSPMPPLFFMFVGGWMVFMVLRNLLIDWNEFLVRRSQNRRRQNE
ncbi:hypothetical protein BH10PLA2_BH10PLA2_12810 [soil metagenome]